MGLLGSARGSIDSTCSAARGRCLHRTLVPALLCSVQCAPLSLLSRKCKEYRATELYMLTSTSKGSSCLSSTAAEIAREKLAFKKYRISGGWTRYQMPALPLIFLIMSHSYVETLLARSLLALGVLHVNSQKLREREFYDISVYLRWNKALRFILDLPFSRPLVNLHVKTDLFLHRA